MTPLVVPSMGWALLRGSILTTSSRHHGPGRGLRDLAGEVMGNAYDRLIRFDVNDPSKLVR
jgi:hypothetical protein